MRYYCSLNKSNYCTAATANPNAETDDSCAAPAGYQAKGQSGNHFYRMGSVNLGRDEAEEDCQVIKTCT